MSDAHARPGTDDARSDDDWRRAQDATGTQPGAVVAWFTMMALMLGGFALMGASFAQDNGVVFTAGLLLSGLAFLVPLALLGRTER